MRHDVFPVFRSCRGPIVTAVLATLLATSGWALGADVPARGRFLIQQPAQPLAESLLAIARQTGAALLFDPVAVRGLMSAPISGQFSAAEAIALALQGTRLVVEARPDGSLVVKPGPGARASAVPPSEAAPLRVAQAAAATSDAGQGPAPDAAAEPVPVEKVEITGSRLRRIDADAALPVNVYRREEIERSGQPTLDRFLATLNEVSVGQGEGSYSTTTQGQGTVQLRGLPLGSTLVLINGRRVQAVGSSSGNFFNLKLIPLAAVERVEVVPVGSSAVYGGDALAGVVNVILKKSIDGGTFGVRLATGEGFGDGGVSLGLGDSGARGSWLFLGSLNTATPLKTGERAFFRDMDYRRFGGVDARVRSCTPGTVTSTNGANLPGLNAPVAGIPVTAPGQPLTIQSFAATAGRPNLCSTLGSSNGSALIHGSETLAVHGSIEYRWLEALSTFGEATLVQDQARVEDLGLSLNNVLVPASNPNNPFGVPVRVTARLARENGQEGYERNTAFSRVLLGLRGELGGGFDFEATGSTSRDKGDRLLLNNAVSTAARAAALATTNPAASLNPFATGRAASDEVLRGIWSDAVRKNFGRKDLVTAFVRGPVLGLPAGPVDVIVGAEVSRDRYDTVLPDTRFRNSRKSGAAYGELRVPLWQGAAEGAQDWTMAALTLAGRRDRYSDFGSASTYQAGLELRPVRTALLRASLATSFKPPTLLQTAVDELRFPIEVAGLTDPRRNNEPVTNGEWVRTTNRTLKPENGEAHAVGAVWEPEAASGLRLAATAWSVRIDGLIGVLPSQTILDNEALFPGWVIREAAAGSVPGRVTRLSFAESNFGFVQTRGFDLEASWSGQAAIGRWTLSASGTRTTEYTVAITPGAPAEERVGRRFVEYWAPKWKARLGTSLNAGAWNVGFASRYLGAYKDQGTSQRTLGSTWVHDISGGLNLRRLGLDLGQGKAATLSLALLNITNELPQFVDASPYFDTSQGDWRGRHASVRFSVDW
jgi:iron complex outermembrane recepter protein